jgi:threonine synthase
MQDWTKDGLAVFCRDCGKPPQEKFPFQCPECGGLYDVRPLHYAPHPSRPRQIGLERYRASFPIPPESTWISLGEGNTPLVPTRLADQTLYLKCEHLNPTGSFKDRGTVVLVNALAAAGVTSVIDDSSGNAGSSLAAYAARAGIEARIFVPETASGPKFQQIIAYGAEAVRIPGPRVAAAEAVLQEARAGAIYASHAHLPHGLAGMATTAYELVEQLGAAPGSVVLPVGGGSMFLGLMRGFKAMLAAGVIENMPQMVAVQASACTPVWSAFTGSPEGVGSSLAEGILIRDPLRIDEILENLGRAGGQAVVVDDDGIREGLQALGARGFFVEPTSAVIWPALVELVNQLPAPVVAVLTGTGLKAVS